MADSWIMGVCEGFMDFRQEDFEAMLRRTGRGSTARGPRDGDAVDSFLSEATRKDSVLYICSLPLEVDEVHVSEQMVEVEVPAGPEDEPAPAPEGGEGGESKEGEGESKEGEEAAPGGAAAAPAGPRMVKKLVKQDVIENRRVRKFRVTAAVAQPPPDAYVLPQASEDSGAPGGGRTGRGRDGASRGDGGRDSKSRTGAAAAAAAPSGDVVVGSPKVVYFIKTTDGKLHVSPGGGSATSGGADPVNDYMCEVVEFGSMSQDVLTSLDRVVREVFVPVLEPQLQLASSNVAAGGMGASGMLNYGGLGGGNGKMGGAGGEDGDDAGMDGTQSVVSGLIGRRRQGGGGATVAGGGTVFSGDRDRSDALSAAPSTMRGPGGAAAGGTNRSVFNAGGAAGGASVFGGPAGNAGHSQNGNQAGAGVVGRPATLPAPVEEDKLLAAGAVGDGVKGEFRSALTRFSTAVSHTLQQVSTQVRLAIPAVTIRDPKVAAQDETLKTELVNAVEGWTALMSSLTSKPVTDRDKGLRALTELEFWRQRAGELSTVYDQLVAGMGGPSGDGTASAAPSRAQTAAAGPTMQSTGAASKSLVRAIIQTLEVAREPVLDGFTQGFGDLSRCYVEARDNVKFLSTLERHFKVLSGGSLAAVADIIPSLMNGLRMVWVISRYYNTDATMLPLMRRIANELADKVSSEVNIKSVLRLARTNPQEAVALVQNAKSAVDAWYSSYMAVRERLERGAGIPGASGPGGAGGAAGDAGSAAGGSGRDHRWEFDRRILFDKTDHISTVLGDMLTVLSTTQELGAFFRGNELRSLSDDPAALSAIAKLVDRLPAPMLRLSYSVYDRARAPKWRQEMTNFMAKVADLEARTEAFLSAAFSQPRSAEGAFDLLEKLQGLDMRESIRKLLEVNMDNIIRKARAELADTVALFHAQKDSPPMAKNSPPIAGAIAWANSLYLRQKRPILRFKTFPAIFSSSEGEALRREYIEFARGIDGYIKALYSGWCERAKTDTPILLRQAVLGPALLDAPPRPRDILALTQKHIAAHPDDRAGYNMLVATAATVTATNTIGLSPVDRDSARLPSPPYAVNFSRELGVTIREAKLLDRMGYPVPEAALSIALQEAQLNEARARLQEMLGRYHSILRSLSPPESNLMQAQLLRLRAAIRPGFTPLNWNSLHINAFITETNKAIQDFEGLLSQVRKSASMLEDACTSIADTVLLDPAEFAAAGPQEVSDVYDMLERQRTTRLDALVHRYRSVKPIFQQIEGFIAGTDTCASPALAEFYRYWERRFFNAITKVVISSMATFQALLNVGTDTAAAAASAAGGAAFPPLCLVRTHYSVPDVVLTPDLNFISKFLRRAVNQLIKSAKSFIRWMEGTCLEVEIGGLQPGESMPDFSFFEDIKVNPEIVALLMALNPAVIRVFNQTKKFISLWGLYGQPQGLWAVRKPDADKRLLEASPPASVFDSRLHAFSSLAEGVDGLPQSRDVGFLRVDCAAVAGSCRSQALKLARDLGTVLQTIAKTRMDELVERFDKLFAALEPRPADLEELKAMLGLVASILDSRVETEALIADVEQRYVTLAAHGIPLAPEEATTAAGLAVRWQQLVDAALTKDRRLVKIKDQFRSVTQAQVAAFTTSCDEMRQQFFASGPTSAGVSLSKGLALMAEYRAKLAAATKSREELCNAERLFALPMTRYPQLQAIQDEIDRVAPLYDLYAEQLAFAEVNSATLWADLDIAALQKGADELVKRLNRLRDLKGSGVYLAVSDEVTAFRDSLPLIASLKNPAMKERHWEKISVLTGIKIDLNPRAFTLGSLFAMNLARFADAIGEIVTEAKGELKIEKDLKAIADKWAVSSFTLLKYTKNGETKGSVLKPAEETKVDLEDHLLNLQAMAGSRFVSIFQASVGEWEKKLNLVSETLDVWYVTQTKWQYLEGIFGSSEDIRQQLPEEAKKFSAIDKEWKNIMLATAKNPNVLDACCEPGRFEMLKTLGERLDQCQKSLSEYLNTKRNAFPRFFFISDDELLSVLGSSDPTSICVHLLKLFDNVKDFGFGRGNSQVVSLASSEGEGFSLRTPAPVEGPVETWMTGAEAEMHASLHAIMKEGVFAYANTPRLQWVSEQMGMVAVAGSQIWWTWETEDVFRRVRKGDKYAMKTYAEKLTRQLMELVSRVRDDIPKMLRLKVITLLIVDVHARDIVDTFVRDSILDPREFAWESQLRFYWDRDVDDIYIRQCTGQFRYGYEYMGLNGRLVITPLTDRCYMTLTQALTFNLGGSPAGPAGTGKTETTKDLAKNLAIPCFVINCSGSLDYLSMGSTFSGLTQVGAWGCFDEFNRINIEVLSVVSAQIRAIQNALNYGRDTVDIGMGSEIRVNRKVGIFITMNPGYAGRTELPDNLKALFRPVTMIVPDLLQICEIMLFSEGFEGARVLAKKMTTLYKLAKEQLSKAPFYDFGLRALRSVLVMAGSLKREFSDMPEDLVLMRSLRDSNMPKFIFEDVPLFQGLIIDLFPGLDCPRVAYPELKAAVEAELERQEMRHDDEATFQFQVDKVIQLYEIILTRHTTMIAGPTGGGKTVVLQTLQKASLAAFERTIKAYTLNPKAQSVDELYGVMDPATRDWTDGILSKLFRSCNEPQQPGKDKEVVNWIVFDGDVDAVWVENMNSVMDDNRLLTLPNGERIRLQNYCKLIIEVFDLQYASPATISRCGVVFVDPKYLGYRPFYIRWVKQRCRGKETEANNLMDLFQKYVPRLLGFVLEGEDPVAAAERRANGGERAPAGEDEEPAEEIAPLDSAVQRSNLNLVQQLCSLLDAILAGGPLGATGPASLKQEPGDGGDASPGGAAPAPAPAAAPAGEWDDFDALEGMFIFALTWSLGAAVGGRHRRRFSDFLQSLADGSTSKNTLYEAFFNHNTRKWTEWSTVVPEYKPPTPFEFHRILVPTTDSVLYTWLLSKLVAADRPVIFVGESGTAKTVTIQNYLTALPSEGFSMLNINFSSRTMSKDVQTNIEANVDKRSGKVYGPPVGKKLMVFIDDLNMPRVDTYGTQQPIALLHFLVGRGCMYDRGKDLDLRTYKDLLFLGAMGPPGGGRAAVDPRFMTLFSVFNLTPPTTEVLARIYGSILSQFTLPFPEPVQAAAAKLTDATLKLYAAVLDRLPPTPAKFHYVFTLRDLGRIYQGLCLATPDVVNTPAAMVRLWRNEAVRIFSDRLINQTDAGLVHTLIKDIVGRQFTDVAESVMSTPLVFGDYSNAVARLVEGKEDARLYKDLGDYASVRTIADQVLEAYNMEAGKPMMLVLFEQALEHLTRIHRILRMPRGNALLVGVGGSGKQSLTKLATFMAGYRLFEVTLVRNYGEPEFREDLKAMFKLAGTGPVTFLLTDAHVIEEGFLEYVNNILTTGMPPALYETDEKDALINATRAEAKAAGLVDTRENVWSYFVSKCRYNLHIVLAMSPSGDTLRRRCRNFPGLVSCTTIDWFTPWPADALIRVAENFLREESLPEEFREAIISHMVKVHTGVVAASARFETELRRHNYVTPKNYLDYIATYRAQLASQRSGITTRTKRLEGGLTKLAEAQSAVDLLSTELREQKVVVDAKTADVEALIKGIGERQAIADRQQAEAQAKQKELAITSKEIEVESAKANVALEAALPALEAAASALDNLNKDDITEIRAFNTPPPLVMMVGMCVLHLRPTGKEDESAGWKGAKAMMSDASFLKSLKTYDKDKLTGKMIAKVQHYFKDKDFNLERMATVSKAGAGLLQWVVAIKDYYLVARDVEPLKKKVADMEKQQAESQAELAAITEALARLTAELAELDIKYQAASTELAELKERAGLMERRLEAASKLIAGLGSERTRWSNDVGRLQGQFTRLVGDCLLAAGFLSYLGPFTFEYRQRLLNEEWLGDVASRKIPHTANFVVEDLLTDEATIQRWVGEGLPGDSHSVMNGILTTKTTRRFPLCIDPQLQAVAWIKAREGSDLKVATFLDGDFMQPLKLAIQYGKPFLFENVDETLDPMVDPVLEQSTYMDGTQRVITIDDKPVPWDDNFRLYLTTKLANPHYSPEVMGKVQIVNYGVTQQGLENQLLNTVVGHERPDLEKAFKELVEQMSANAGRLADLEESLLRNLAQSQGNILDNEELIGTLESAKSKALEIGAKLSQAQITKADINRTRAMYTPAAKRGSILFFVMAGLSNISKMYEISLSSFLVVFRRSLALAKKAASLEARLENMVNSATRECYDYTCTGIFEKHKLLFSFQLTCMICASETGELSRPELDFFLKGDMSLDLPAEANPAPAWLLEQGWKDLLRLSVLGTAADNGWAELLAHFRQHGEEWRAWYDLETPEVSPLPGGFTDRLNPFQRLLVLRCFRPDRVYNGVKSYVMWRMGEVYVQPPVLDYNRIHAQSSSTTPVVFVLSPGADPQSDIQALGTALGFTPPTKFKFLALGQGQAAKAEEMLEQGMLKGYWVLLANCHLLLSWMKNLEKILQQASAGGKAAVHPDFRLWLTTDPTDSFPLGILQRSLKVVTEPPDGLKLNMRASYSRITPEIIAECPHPGFRPLVFALVFLHAVVLERRKFGKLGWNVPYDFNESDFNISRRLLALYLSKAWDAAGLTAEDAHAFEMGEADPEALLRSGRCPVPWGSLRYLIGDAMYGGRVSDSFDRRVLTTYLDEFMGDFLFDPANPFKFSSAGYDYALPAWGPLDTYVQAVEGLPLLNGPAVLGLNTNAEINVGVIASKRLWSDMVDLQPRDGGGDSGDSSGGGGDGEDYLTQLVRDLAAKIPDPTDVPALRRHLSAATGTITPTQVVLLQELERWGTLVTSMAVSLADLKRALAGEIGLSDALEEVSSALAIGRLPNPWRSLAPETQKPLGSWMAHFAARYKQYQAWIALASAPQPQELPVIWLSGLHIPESYLTALVQTTCRRKGWPLDRSALTTSVTRYVTEEDIASITAPPADGCYVRGLYLEGAAWDVPRSKLRRQDPKVLVVDLPVMLVTPIESARVQGGPGIFRTPVYVTQARRNAMGQGLVFEADLATDDHSSHWVLQGVSLCLNIDN